MRLLADAGMVLVVGVLAVSCTSDPTDTDKDGVVSPATSTTDGSVFAATSSTPPTTSTILADHEPPSSSSPETSTIEDGCDSSLPSTTFPGDGLETFHTLVPGSSELRFVVEATPTTVCSGGVIHLTVSIHNPTGHSLKEAPVLVMTDVYPHVVIANLAATDVLAGATVTVFTSVTVPQLPAGAHEIFVMSARSPQGATIEVENPTG